MIQNATLGCYIYSNERKKHKQGNVIAYGSHKFNTVANTIIMLHVWSYCHIQWLMLQWICEEQYDEAFIHSKPVFYYTVWLPNCSGYKDYFHQLRLNTVKLVAVSTNLKPIHITTFLQCHSTNILMHTQVHIHQLYLFITHIIQLCHRVGEYIPVYAIPYPHRT